MSIDLVAGKVRGFLFEETTRTAATGVVVVLEAELDDGLWRPVGALAADHAGYVSFSLDPIRDGGRTHVRGLRVRVSERTADIAPHVSLAAPAPSFVMFVNHLHDMPSPRLPAIQDPDDTDREISPGSFAAPPTILLGEECDQLIPGGLAGFDYGVYRVLRIDRLGADGGGIQPVERLHTDDQASRATGVLSRVASLSERGAEAIKVDVSQPLAELAGDPQQVQLGVVLYFVQRWQPVGQCLGDIVYSLPLAPGEARDLAMIDWSRSESISRIDDIDSSEQLMHNQHRDRGIEESINAGLHEHQEGWSFLAGTAGAASANIPIELVNLSISGDHAIGVGISSTTGDRNLAGFSQQDLADTVTQSTTVLRGLRSTVIVQADQNESNTVQTRTITNHNRCHALTIQYYEVLRTYRVTTQLAGADLALLVPHALVNFDATAVLRWRAVLERNLLDPALRDCFDAIAHLQRCSETAYGEEPDTEEPAPEEPTLTYEATSYTIRLDTGPRETWGSVWVNVVADDGARSCLLYKPNVEHYSLGNPADDERDRVLAMNSVRTWVVSANDDQVNGIGLDLRTIESIEVEWVEVNGEDAWAFAGVSVTATADGRAVPILVNGKRYFGTRPYIQKFDNSGHVHQVWAAPAKVEQSESPPQDPGPDPVPAPHGHKRDRDSDECCAAMLIGHLNDNAGYYSRVVWVGMDSSERRLRLVSALGAQIANAIEDRPLAVGGNQVAFQLNALPMNDPRIAELIGKPEPAVRYATVPARGVFAEAELGRCNACERRDVSRMVEWSPIRPPQIGEITPGPRGTTPQVEPAALPGPVIQVVQAPNAPDPSGLGAALTLLGQPNIFRDMSGRAELEHLLNGLATGAIGLTEAQILAQQVKDKQTPTTASPATGTPAGGQGSSNAARTPATESDAGRQLDRLDIIDQARRSGLITDEDARGATLGVVGGEPSPQTTGVQQAAYGVGDSVYWADLLTFTPPAAVRTGLTARGLTIVPATAGWGDVNLDYYPVRISKLPTVNGKQLDAAEFLEHVRLHFNDFIDVANSEFVPLDVALDKPKWESNDPVGAVINIKVNTGDLLGLPPMQAFIDQSLVVCTKHESQHWILSTARGGSAAGHPVSGNRMWAIGSKGNEWIFYTMGADRATSVTDWAANAIDLLWRGADALWRSLQKGITEFVNDHDGSAQVATVHSHRYDWSAVRQYLAINEQQT